MEKKFILPEKWCVENIDNCLEPFSEQIPNNYWSCNSTNNYYFYNSSNYFDFLDNGDFPKDYTEITLDQFKQYVLKLDVEIILKKDNYNYLKPIIIQINKAYEKRKICIT